MNGEQKLLAAFAAEIARQVPPAAVKKAAAAGRPLQIRVRLATPAERAAREQEKAAAAGDMLARLKQTLASSGYPTAQPAEKEPAVLAGWNRVWP